MLSSQKLRVNLLAKDLELKSKELTDLFTEFGITGKTSTATVEPWEFEVLIDKLTERNQITNMGDYLSGKAIIKTKNYLEKIEKEDLAEDEEKSLKNDIQDLVNEYNKDIERLLKEKEQELMTI